MGCCYSAPPEIPDDAPVVDLDSAHKMLKTGDLVLYGGTGGSSGLIRCTSINRRWSHVGVVVMVRLPDGRSVKAVTEAYPSKIDEDLFAFGGWRFHTGTQTVELRKRLDTYEGQVAFRILRRGDGSAVPQAWRNEWAAQFRTLIYRDGGRYALDLIRMYQNMHRGDDDLTGQAYVCSGWVARILQEFGILRDTDIDGTPLEWGNFTLFDFSNAGHLPYTRNADRVPNYRYASVTFIVNRTGALPQDRRYFDRKR
jgi:hypothetical protein